MTWSNEWQQPMPSPVAAKPSNPLDALNQDQLLTQFELFKILSYNPWTGKFIWLKSPNTKIRIGDIAGSEHIKGYWHTKINGKQYLNHQLAWLYMTGEFTPMIDHVDTNGFNNIWTNLRETNKITNNCNRGPIKSNKLGVKGVTKSKCGKKFQVNISYNNINYYLGTFDTIEKASQFYQIKSKELHREFARNKNE